MRSGLAAHVCLFDLSHYVPSTIFQLCRDRSSWLSQYLARINVSCSRTQRSDAGEALTRSPFTCHIFSHFSSASRSSGSLFASASDLTSLYKRQSSAERRESEWLTASGRSLMKAKKSKGLTLCPVVHQKSHLLGKICNHPMAPALFCGQGKTQSITGYVL